MRALALDEVVTAFNTYMRWLYFVGSISVPTRIYFALAALADDSRGFNARKYEPSKTKVCTSLFKLGKFIVENQLINCSCFRFLSEYFETFEKRASQGDLQQLWRGYTVHYAVPRW